MPDPRLISRAQRAATMLERAWDRWRATHELAAEPLPPVSSYVGYSIEEPWGRPRVVFGVDAADAEKLAALLHECAATPRAAEQPGSVEGSLGGALPPPDRPSQQILDEVRARIPAQGRTPEINTARGQNSDAERGVGSVNGSHLAGAQAHPQDQILLEHIPGDPGDAGDIQDPAAADTGDLPAVDAADLAPAAGDLTTMATRGGAAADTGDQAAVRARDRAAPGAGDPSAVQVRGDTPDAAVAAHHDTRDPAAAAGHESGDGREHGATESKLADRDPADGEQTDCRAAEPAAGNQGAQRPHLEGASADASSISRSVADTMAAELAGWAAGELPGQASARLAAWATVAGASAGSGADLASSGSAEQVRRLDVSPDPQPAAGEPGSDGADARRPDGGRRPGRTTPKRQRGRQNGT